ncbi:pectinesterase/pectinesterase inhibitor 28 [Canna indica]|uniref:Pectinesterase n=1 Tax=Canna indica TaxID=4628 RepID=A0AAQ3Q8F3_9LILI|nr:pectinesterase/pectinesterase inhibitor 28 [Canna indica]
MGNQKVVIIGVSVVVLVAVIGTVAVTLSSSHSSAAQPTEEKTLSTSQKNIQEFCSPTDYRQTCEDALHSVTGNDTDPKQLMGAIFNITIDNIKKAFDHSSVLSEAAKDPRTSEALENCRELLDYAIEDLRTSVSKIDDLSFGKVGTFIDDLKIWLSATITYQTTCLDGFENTTTDAGESMRKALNSSKELTSNILAIITKVGDTVSEFNLGLSRKLLSDEYPSWFSPSKRRLLQLSLSELKPNIVVAQDGSGDVQTINEALLHAPKKSQDTFIIYIKEGVYKEKIQVNRSNSHVMMIGDGPDKTKITGNLNYVDGIGTFRTATLGVVGDDFIGKDLWIENSAGPAKHQAVAMRSQSDRTVFYNVRFDGYQDTLYAHANRQFYRDCNISGTIDFIFGDSASIFQNCLIIVRKPLDNQRNIVTAQGRDDKRGASAIILHNCTITADPEYYPFRAKLPTYLGRPWKIYSRTIVMQSQLDDLIHPDGWLPWNGDYGLNTLFYTEIDNRGPGADKSKRVAWKGVKKVDYGHASKYTVENFIKGNKWLPQTGVPFFPGMLPQTQADRIH